MSTEYETKEVTVTKISYKTYTPNIFSNEIVVSWQNSIPFSIETTLESAVIFLREDQRKLLNRAKKTLESAKITLKEEEDRVAIWESRLNAEYTLVDKTK